MTDKKVLILDFSDPRIWSMIEWHIQQLPREHLFQAGLSFCIDWLSGMERFEFHTSGTTGPPKLLEVSKAQILDSVLRTGDFLGLQQRDSVFVCLNTQYTGGKMMLARAMYYQMKAHIVLPQQDPFYLFPKEELVALMALAPSQMIHLLNNTGHLPILEQTKTILLGGAPVNAPLLRQIRNIKSCAVYETFGMTETLSHIALKKLNGDESNMAFEVMKGVSAETDERGCLRIKAPVTNDKWITTNDLVEMSDTLHFIWKGRIDHIVNSGGVKILLEELEKLLEALLKEWGYEEEFVLGSEEDPILGSKLVLYLQGTERDTSPLSLYLKENLPLYHNPKKIVYLDHLPRTSAGKFIRIKK